LVSANLLPKIAETIMLDGARLTNPEEFLPADAALVLKYAWDGKPLDRVMIDQGGNEVKY
jgi:hypothetical protein